MGAVWDRRPLHAKGLGETIPELLLPEKPTLHAVEAARVMLAGGPRGHGDSNCLASQMLIVSMDPVADDAACAKILESKGIRAPKYIEIGERLGLGVADLSRLNVQRLGA
jgi:uncharacterized protein (DUF362 family)